MKKIKTGLIGCGKVGHLHASALVSLPRSEFVAVCDRDAGRVQAFARQYGVKAYTDIAVMIADSGVEMVNVCTPHPIHAAPAVEAMRAGAHVLVEKPLASSLADCDAMINTAQKAGILLGTMSQRRFYEPVLRIRQAIAAGKIGRPMLGNVVMFGWRDEAYYKADPWRGTWKGEGGGVLVNQAVHQLDILQWLMGDIDEVYGCITNINHSYIEVEDTAVAVIRFKGGGLGNVILSNSQHPALYCKVHVFGDNGASVGVQTDGGAMFLPGRSEIVEPPYNDLWTVPGEENMMELWKQKDTEFFNSICATQYYHERQIEDFLEAAVTGGQPLVDGAEGRKTVELFTAVYRTARNNRPVQFPLVPEDQNDFGKRIQED